MKPGEALERLVAGLERGLAGNDAVKIEAPKRLPDKTTGRLREHDVVLTVSGGHHALLIAIECRDQSRPVTVNQVEGFWAKCQHTGIGQGVIVSVKGFCGSARTKAQNLGIRCLDIEEAGTFDWLHAEGLVVVSKKVHSFDWKFFVQDESYGLPKQFDIVDNDGNVVTLQALNSNAVKLFDKEMEKNTQANQRPPDPVDNAEFAVQFPAPNLNIRDTSSQSTMPVGSALAKLCYSITHKRIPFKLMQYTDRSRDSPLAEAAYVDLSDGKANARLVITSSPSGTAIVLVPTRHKAKAGRESPDEEPPDS